MLTMLTQRNFKAVVFDPRLLLLVALLGCSFWARTQDAVSFLKAETVEDRVSDKVSAVGEEQAFRLDRNLIFFPAMLDGRRGSFILDTGAPTLLLNSRGKNTGSSGQAGIAAGGNVTLTNQRVESFAMGGRELGKRWALALDLRSMESRMGQPIDGFVGQQLLRQGEVRINYPGRTFQLLKSKRSPRHEGRPPTRVIRFEYVDHLPVITLEVEGHKLRFAVDTGAGTNLIDGKHRQLSQPTGERMNIQGLGGENSDQDIVTMPLAGPTATTCVRFTLMDLDHLQSPGSPPIAGILGSVFLTDFVVGIDYRRKKIYFW